MPSVLTVEAVHKGDMRVSATNGQFTIDMDYPTPSGAPLTGFTPLQLLLASLAGCAANSVSALLKRSKQPISGLEVKVKGDRRDEHPTLITNIEMEFIVKGAGLDAEVVERVIKQSEELICPVWNMLKGTTPIKSTFKIEK